MVVSLARAGRTGDTWREAPLLDHRRTKGDDK
jgi:hypothetical protein